MKDLTPNMTSAYLCRYHHIYLIDYTFSMRPNHTNVITLFVVWPIFFVHFYQTALLLMPYAAFLYFSASIAISLLPNSIAKLIHICSLHFHIFTTQLKQLAELLKHSSFFCHSVYAFASQVSAMKKKKTNKEFVSIAECE